MSDYDFGKLKEEPPRRRRRREDDEPYERRTNHGELAMFILAAFAVAGGVGIFNMSKTVFHELVAANCFVIAAILFVGGMIYGKMDRD